MCTFLVHYEEVHVEEGMVPLEQSTLRKLKINFLFNDVSEVIRPPNACGSTRSEVSECK